LPTPFTKTELEFLKRYLEIQFGEVPNLRDGLVLKTWKSGELKGRPKLPAPLQSLVDRSLECAPAGAQIGRFELTPLAGLPEDGSHDETSITQRRVQAASC